MAFDASTQPSCLLDTVKIVLNQLLAESITAKFGSHLHHWEVAGETPDQEACDTVAGG